jgi:transposase
LDGHSFTPEFEAEIVELCGRGDRSVGQVAKDFDRTETAVPDWAGRPRTRRLREDVEILRRATALFAKETR